MTTGADLVILALDGKHGTVRRGTRLGFAVAAADVVDLAVSRCIGAAVNQNITISESLRTGDPTLGAVLDAITAEPAGHRVSGWVRRSARDRVGQYVEAMVASGELVGRPSTPDRPSTSDQPESPDHPEPAEYSDLHCTDATRRESLVERLVTVATADTASLKDEAFGALAYAAGISDHVLGLGQRQARRRLKDLAGWFAETSRYLPDFQGGIELTNEDLAPWDVNPAADEPWRLAVRLAVQEAVLVARKSRGLRLPGGVDYPPYSLESMAYISTPS